MCTVAYIVESILPTRLFSLQLYTMLRKNTRGCNRNGCSISQGKKKKKKDAHICIA